MKFYFAIPLLLLNPLSAFAVAPGNLTDAIQKVTDITSVAIPVLAALALMLFFWGVVRFIFGSGNGNETVIKEGKTLMLWGTIALFVTFSIWGLSRLTSDFFFHNTNTTSPPVPTLPAIGALGS